MASDDFHVPVNRKLIVWQNIREIEKSKARPELNEIQKQTAEQESFWPAKFSAHELNLLRDFEGLNFRQILSKQETQVLKKYVLYGKSNRQIAKELNIEPKQVVNIWTRVRTKIQKYIKRREASNGKD